MDDILELRKKLDLIDAELIRLFAERMAAAEEIGRYKRVKGLPIEDLEREEAVVSSRLEKLPEERRDAGERFVRLLIDESKRVQTRGLNVYLIGMPDCGKTRTAKKLHVLTGLPVCDTDKLIMRTAGKTIDEIFDSSGEEFFRLMEAAVLRSAAAKGGMIVALGGGTPLYGDNASIMRYSGITVFLDRAPERLLNQNILNRPLLRGKDQEEINAKILRQYGERHDRYAACADLVTDPDAEGAAESIAGFLYTRKYI